MERFGTLTFLWPSMLWLLVAVPLAALLYFRIVGRRARYARHYAGLAATGTPTGRLRRGLPAAVLLLGLTALILAVARPQSFIMLPARVSTIVLAMDVSGSMPATDIEPSRLAAAQKAAKTFVSEQPGRVRVGVVSVAGTAAVVQSPTDNREDIYQAIDRFQLQRGTALGSGLLIALATLLPNEGIDVQGILNDAGKHDGRPPRPPPAGTDAALAIVLLSDGQSNTGPDPLAMAKLAAARGVRVYTVGVGTPEGAVLTTHGWSMRVRLDDEILKKIAAMTGAEYFRAGSADDLRNVYRSLGARLVLEKHQAMEVTALFAALGAVLASIGALLSLAWFSRIL